MAVARSKTLIETNHCADQREFAIRFALWCNGLAGIPSADRIRVHWECLGRPPIAGAVPSAMRSAWRRRLHREEQPSMLPRSCAPGRHRSD